MDYRNVLYSDDKCRYLGGYLPIVKDNIDVVADILTDGVRIRSRDTGELSKVWCRSQIFSAAYVRTSALYSIECRGTLTGDDMDGLSILREHGIDMVHAASLLITDLDVIDSVIYDVRLEFRDAHHARLFLKTLQEVFGIEGI